MGEGIDCLIQIFRGALGRVILALEVKLLRIGIGPVGGGQCILVTGFTMAEREHDDQNGDHH
jgi:hypothetical protein